MWRKFGVAGSCRLLSPEQPPRVPWAIAPKHRANCGDEARGWWSSPPPTPRLCGLMKSTPPLPLPIPDLDLDKAATQCATRLDLGLGKSWVEPGLAKAPGGIGRLRPEKPVSGGQFPVRGTHHSTATGQEAPFQPQARSEP